VKESTPLTQEDVRYHKRQTSDYNTYCMRKRKHLSTSHYHNTNKERESLKIGKSQPTDTFYFFLSSLIAILLLLLQQFNENRITINRKI
jgi:hypothetical protein